MSVAAATQGNITRTVLANGNGHAFALERLVPLVYEEMRSLAEH